MGKAMGRSGNTITGGNINSQTYSGGICRGGLLGYEYLPPGKVGETESDDFKGVEMLRQLLAPKVEDVDLVLSWLPPQGAEAFRIRLLEVRTRLLAESTTSPWEQDLDHPVDEVVSTGILAAWLNEMERELEQADLWRAQQIEKLLTFLDR